MIFHNQWFLFNTILARQLTHTTVTCWHLVMVVMFWSVTMATSQSFGSTIIRSVLQPVLVFGSSFLVNFVKPGQTIDHFVYFRKNFSPTGPGFEDDGRNLDRDWNWSTPSGAGQFFWWLHKQFRRVWRNHCESNLFRRLCCGEVQVRKELYF